MLDRRKEVIRLDRPLGDEIVLLGLFEQPVGVYDREPLRRRDRCAKLLR